MGRILVAGSCNVDITARMESLPCPGETVGGASLAVANGGKGANQAVAAARTGGDVVFLTAVGDDDHGRMLRNCFSQDGMDVSLMKFVPGTPTGTALIFVDGKGENCIAVAPGANGHLLPEDVMAAEKVIADAQYVLLQLEIPVQTAEAVVRTASKYGVRTVLNPAPMTSFPEDLLSGLYLITPNETEVMQLTGIEVSTPSDAAAASAALKGKGVRNVVITMGSMGSYMDFEGETPEMIPAPAVTAVDTTAAGDVYNGALVTALAEGMSPAEACRFATKAAAVSVTRCGAQTSVPYRKEI